MMKQVYRLMSTRAVFDDIYKCNGFKGDISISGPGSDMEHTKNIREALPRLVKQYGVKTFLDLPCGDLVWMKNVNLDADYIGADIVREIIEENESRYPDKRFMLMDVIKDRLPPVDMLFCRDCFVHLSNKNIVKALDNIRASDIKYLIATTFPGVTINQNIVTGDWRPINLELPPFNLSGPLEIINEGCTDAHGNYGDKSIGVWRL